MELYLVQHGQATSKEEDPARPLTPRGHEEVTRVARAAAKMRPIVATIFHSGKLRAEQTAEILAAALQPTRGLQRRVDLAPKDDPTTVAASVEQSTEPSMLVGHLPHLSRLASHLLTGDAELGIIEFRMGGIVCLTRAENGWHVRWILTPELV